MRRWYVTDANQVGHSVEADAFEVEGDYLVFLNWVGSGGINVAAFFRATAEKK